MMRLLRIKNELSYRCRMPVTEVVFFKRQQISYPRCPRCHNTFEFEYSHFCDRCGQCLDWQNYHKASVEEIL